MGCADGASWRDMEDYRYLELSVGDGFLMNLEMFYSLFSVLLRL